MKALQSIVAQFVLMVGSVLLVGCGGGGSAGTQDNTEQLNEAIPPTTNTVTPTPVTPPPPPVSTETATYRVTFSTIWDDASFPTQYPTGRHFSPLVGMTHNEQVSMWQDAGLATPGVEDMAETGNRLLLNSEIQAFIDQNFAEFLLNGSGISSFESQTQLEFNISPQYPLVTLVSMVAPSPDWFVGVNAISLLDDNGQWRPMVNMGLSVLDAGTDSGLSYESSNEDSQPQESIILLTTDAAYTDFQAGIHRDSGKTIATFRFELL